MITDNTLLVFIIVGALALLAILQITLAIRHDHVVTASGPMQTIEALKAQISQLQETRDTVKEQIDTLQQDLANQAKLGADVEALRRQKEDLLAEWNAMDDKRAEVQAMRREIEDVVIERQSLEAEIAPLRAEFLEVKDRLEKAEELVGRIDALKSEHDTVSARVEALRDELRRLEEAEARVARLEEREKALESACARLDGQTASQQEQLAELGARLTKERDALAEAQSEHDTVSARVEALRDELRRLEEAEARVARLEEREKALESTCARLDGQTASQQDQLAELGARLSKERDALAEAQSEQARITAQTAAGQLELRRQQGKIEAFEETRSTLTARLAYLEGEIAKAEGRTTDADGVETDKLRELREKPPVIRAMADWPLAQAENETDALKRVERRLQAKGLRYPVRTLHAFHTAMKVNETTQMAVLAGISGTGKSQLPRQYAAGMGIGFLQVPVQPRWDSPQDLMGFYNYIEGKFRPTDMARALWALDEVNNSDAVEDRMMMILLDEMNLARVEYYFSDFLSRLESRPAPADIADVNERKDAEIELEIPNMQRPPRIFPGYNLLFAGTMNEDESTQSLSDKVVDRANVLRFAAPKAISASHREGEIPEVHALPRSRWQGWVRPVSRVEGEARVRGGVETMVDLMKEFKRPIGHRLGRAIMAYVANYPEAEGTRPIEDALADQVEMRLLPKLRGVDVEISSSQFSRLRTFAEQELGDEKLGQAIADSVQASEDTGQFVWSGVTR